MDKNYTDDTGQNWKKTHLCLSFLAFTSKMSKLLTVKKHTDQPKKVMPSVLTSLLVVHIDISILTT